MIDKELHQHADAGYKKTGTTVALDRSEDHMTCREALQFWTENHMRERLNKIGTTMEERFKRGKLPWTLRTVKSLIQKYPKTGELDVILPFQNNDEEVPPTGSPLCADDAEAREDNAGYNSNAESTTEAEY